MAPFPRAFLWAVSCTGNVVKAFIHSLPGCENHSFLPSIHPASHETSPATSVVRWPRTPGQADRVSLEPLMTRKDGYGTHTHSPGLHDSRAKLKAGHRSEIPEKETSKLPTSGTTLLIWFKCQRHVLQLEAVAIPVGRGSIWGNVATRQTRLIFLNTYVITRLFGRTSQ